MSAVSRDDSLPSWDLSDLYGGPEDPALAADLDRVAAEATAFEAAVKGALGTMESGAFADALATYEALSETLGRIMSYASLLHAGAMTDPEVGRFYQDMQERTTDIGQHLLFFTLELNDLEPRVVECLLADPRAARYRPWVEDCRQFRDHQLEEAVERLLHERETVGRSAWVRLFDQTMAGLRFSLDGEDLTLTTALDRMSHKDGAIRKAAALEIGRVLESNESTFALITNTLAKDKQIIDKWRRYPTPLSWRNKANQVEDVVVDALVSAVREAYPRLAHRYYAMKARWLGSEVLPYWDRNAPLPEDDDRSFTWTQARDVVLDAYERLSPALAGVGRRFFEQPWIDAPPRPGKTSGAFAHPVTPGVHPYLLVNFMGRSRDVMTLAHELGHGVHQVLAAEQGYLLSATPLTLAETASVFGEMLTFRAMLDAASTPSQRRVMLAGKVEDMLNTVVRQIAFHEFEVAVHACRKEGELSAETLGDLWMDVQSRSLGPALRFDDSYRIYWAYIPHFIHAPFYVYAYAFGDCLVNALYGVYQDEPQGFEQRYLDMLKAGGTKRHGDLLAPFGLNAADPAFWRRGLDVIAGLIDELEALEPGA